MLIAVLGMDQHEVGALTAAQLLRDAGVEVIYLGCFQLPEHVVRTAVDENVDIIGISAHSWEYRDYLPELFEGLRAAGAAIPLVVGGSILTSTDTAELTRLGVAATFGGGSTADQIVGTIRALASAPA
jgi:methylmalonyl-CoA mutase C-terminal domain/subunit